MKSCMFLHSEAFVAIFFSLSYGCCIPTLTADRTGEERRECKMSRAGFRMGREVLKRHPSSYSSRQISSAPPEIFLRSSWSTVRDSFVVSLRSKRFIEVFISRLMTCFEGLRI